MLRINFVEAVVVVLVTVVTVWQDLCVAVVIGTIINAVGFAWTTATQVKVKSEAISPNRRVFRLNGPLFFGSAMNFKKEVDPHNIEEEEVVLDFSDGTILDISGIQAIIEVRQNLMDANKRVLLRGLPAESLQELPKDAEVESPRENT